MRVNPKSWALIVNKLRKCVMVCHNCHSGLIKVPNNAASFNEEFVNYKKIKENQKNISIPCLLCFKLKAPQQKYCSIACSSRSRYKVDWDNLLLEEELKTKSIVALAEELGCSDGAIHKD